MLYPEKHKVKKVEIFFVVEFYFLKDAVTAIVFRILTVK
jgi:hypothetical protein